MAFRLSFLPLALAAWDIYQVGFANSVAADATYTLFERAADASDGIPGYLKSGVRLFRLSDGSTAAVAKVDPATTAYDEDSYYDDDTYPDDTYYDEGVATRGRGWCYPSISYARWSADRGLVHVGCVGPAPFGIGKLNGDP
jgi:hypothetical protein